MPPEKQRQSGLQVSKLLCGYGRRGVVEVELLDLPPQKSSLLVGHNGSGKTTLLKTLCGVLPAVAGKLPKIKSCLLPEELDFPPSVTAANILSSICPQWDVQGKILEVLEIPERTVFRALSKGNRQKLRIAVAEGLAISENKHLLCLDEPLSGLDVNTRRTLIQAWNGHGWLGSVFSKFQGHRILSQHSGQAFDSCQTIVVHENRVTISEPIKNCDNWPDEVAL